MKNPIAQLQKALANRGKKRSGDWQRVRAEHLRREPRCQWCDGNDNLEVHHVKPFHLHPELELDPKNFITLCEEGRVGCHLHLGHLGNFKRSHPTVREDCELHRAEVAASNGK